MLVLNSRHCLHAGSMRLQMTTNDNQQGSGFYMQLTVQPMPACPSSPVLLDYSTANASAAQQYGWLSSDKYRWVPAESAANEAVAPTGNPATWLLSYPPGCTYRWLLKLATKQVLQLNMLYMNVEPVYDKVQVYANSIETGKAVYEWTGQDTGQASIMPSATGRCLLNSS